jgi:hypothetical protein
MEGGLEIYKRLVKIDFRCCGCRKFSCILFEVQTGGRSIRLLQADKLRLCEYGRKGRHKIPKGSSGRFISTKLVLGITSRSTQETLVQNGGYPRAEIPGILDN